MAMKLAWALCALVRVVVADWPEECGGLQMSTTASETECCCLRCGATKEEREGTGDSNFKMLPISECTSQGGQCKHQRTSGYNRGPKGKLAPKLGKATGAEQAHIIGGYPDELNIVFVSDEPQSYVEMRDAHDLETIMKYHGSTNVYTTKQVAGSSNAINHGSWHAFDDDLIPSPNFTKLSECDGTVWGGYTNPGCIYTSSYVHTVLVTGLIPNTAYEYRLAGSGRWRPYKTLPAIGEPIAFAVVADLGMTSDSLATMRHMNAKLVDGTIHGGIFIGDLSYADGYGNGWDEFGRLGEFLWERLPTAYSSGNHEWAAEQFTHFTARYPSPHQKLHDSFNPHWYSYKAGLAHVIMLCSYCESFEGSLQHQWVKDELQMVNRSETPWLIVTSHVPWYTANQHHNMEEGHAMRIALEPLFYEAKADILMVGHLHAYERMTSIHQNATICDGMVHITIGDGGNKEGPACPWWEQRMPEWELRREYSFGHGVLSIANESHAHWSWHRNQDGDNVLADQAWIERAGSRCTPNLIV